MLIIEECLSQLSAAIKSLPVTHRGNHTVHGHSTMLKSDGAVHYG